MAQQKSEDRVVLQGGVMPAEPVGSSSRGRGKTVLVEEEAQQLRLPIATAEDSRESARVVASNLSGTGQAWVPQVVVKDEKSVPVTMEEVTKRFGFGAREGGVE
jgi:hypothetical protein